MKKWKNSAFLDVFNINIILYLAFFCCLFAVMNGTFALDQLSNDQIITAQHNGIISAMCYVLDMITGNLMRAVFGVFIVGTGWMFLLGGIKDWKPILFMTLAIGFILGGEQLAGLISGNEYGCRKLYEMVAVDSETISNGGDCYVAEINTYVSGQKWTMCSEYNSTSCDEGVIANDTIINGGNTIALKTCETGSFKDNENIELRYKCNKNTGLFELVNFNDFAGGRCKKACLLSDLTRLMGAFGAVSATNKSNTYKILNNSGFYKQNKYFTQGSIIDLDCKSGYIEYDENDNPTIDGIKAVCASNSYFDIIGSCRQKCKLSNSAYSNQVATWQKYNKASETWEDTTDTEFYYDEKIRIKECDETKGYFFPLNTDIEGNEIPTEDKNKAVLICGESGAWKKEEGEDIVICSKNCDIRKYQYYDTNSWNICGVWSDICSEPLSDKFNFQSGDSLQVARCLDDEYSVFSSKDIGKLKITCTNGKWAEDGGERCLKKCHVDKIKNFEFVDRWLVCGRAGTCEGFDTISEINSGETIRQNICKDGYFIDSNEATEFLCKDGKLIRKSGNNDEVCRLSCPFKELTDFDERAFVWKRVTSNGVTHAIENVVNLDKAESFEGSASYGDYYAIQNCRESDNFATFADSPLIVKCDEGGKWSAHRNRENICFPKCNFSGIENVKNWSVYSDISQSYRVATENEITNGVFNGVKIRPELCKEGTTLNQSLGGAFYIQCKNGNLVESKSAELCFKDCAVSQLKLDVMTNVEDFVNLTDNTVVDKVNGTLKHGEEIGISICAEGFNLQNRRAVFVCDNGTMKMVNNNDPTEVCKKINN